MRARQVTVIRSAKALKANVDTALDELVISLSLSTLKPWSMAPVKPEGIYGSQESSSKEDRSEESRGSEEEGSAEEEGRCKEGSTEEEGRRKEGSG
jgi:hypothetical protein